MRRLLFVLFPLLLFAGETGKIVGKVVDRETGEPLPGANVMVMETQLGAATDIDGTFIILNVPPGTYSIKASMIGYKPVIQKNVKVRADLTTEVNFFLEPTPIEVTTPIVVIAREPIVKKDVTSSLIVTEGSELKELPVEGFTDVLTKKAGVTVDPSGAIHIRGGRAGEVVYMVDGLPIMDPYSNGIVVDISNTAIKQMELVAGTFNAEYGSAMSGVVNIITPEGGPKYSGSISLYAGDYISTHDSIFEFIDRIDPFSTTEISGNLSGPLPFINNASFFLAGRRFKEKGWLYGINRFLPTDGPGQASGDGRAVPMNPDYRLSLTGKLTFRTKGSSKLSIEATTYKRDYKIYQHRKKFNPLSLPKRKREGIQGGIFWTHVLSPRTYYTLKLGYTYGSYKRYVYEDPHDPRYQYWEFFWGSGLHFDSGGVSNYWLERYSKTYVVKGDFVSQVTKRHLIKTGFEVKRHELYLNEMYITNPGGDPPYLYPQDHNTYLHHPDEFALYIQDKIEFRDMIINAGVRYDYFNPHWKIPADELDPANLFPERHPGQDYIDVKAKTQISPRIGIAFPVSENAIFHFSYGHFFQVPNLRYFYTNSEFELARKANRTWMGNADLKPQKTVAYEVGFKQAIGENFGLEIIGYYKDIRNLLATELIDLYIQGDHYTRYTNKDYGNVRGISVYFKWRNIGNFSGEIDYTYQIAEGNNSYPRDLFADIRHGIEAPKKLVPLDWDERHKINATLTFSKPNVYGISVIATYGSGLPYTPTDERGVRIGEENSGRKPPYFNVDLYAHRDFRAGNVTYSIFLKVYNLLDRMNEVYVYSSTGRATYTRYFNAELADPGWWKRPHYYSPPRSVRIGVSVHF